MAKTIDRILIISLLIVGAIILSSHNYLLFHISIEIFGMAIIAAMFIIAVNTYNFSNNHYFMFLAIAFSYIGLFSFIHTITFKGMNIIPNLDANTPTQLYIALKYLTSISLVLSFFYLEKKLSIKKIFISYALVSVLLLLSIFYWNTFPDCYIEGQGLTPFKVNSEYINSIIFLVVIGLLVKYKNYFHPRIYRNLFLAIISSILSGVSFTLYISVYGLSNMLGHIFQLLSYYFIFQGIIETSLKKPYEFLFFKLSKANENLNNMNQQLLDNNIEMEAQQEELQTDYSKVQEGIEKAIKMHESFLPKSLPKVKDISLAYHYKPAYDLGGDFFNVQRIDDKLLIYIADVSGHGLDGAILNIFIRENINKYLLISQYENKVISPSEILNFLVKQYAKENFSDDYFVCMMAGVLEIKTNKFIYSNAGMHVSPFILDNKGQLTRLDSPGFPIMSALYFEDYPYLDVSVDLTNDYTLLLTTDGLVEEIKDGIMYGEERLTKVLLKNHQKSAEEIVQSITQDFQEFSKTHHSKDDVTYLVIKQIG